MQTRRKIHTQLKVLASLNSLPTNYQKQIHSSQLKRYRETKPSYYFGHELHDILNQEIKWIKQFGDFPTAKKISIAVLKLFVFFRSALSAGKGFKRTLTRQKYYFVELAQRFSNFLPLHKFCKLVGLSQSTLRCWIREVGMGALLRFFD